MFICFDVIHERDGKTDRQTLHDSIDRAVKTVYYIPLLNDLNQDVTSPVQQLG